MLTIITINNDIKAAVMETNGKRGEKNSVHVKAVMLFVTLEGSQKQRKEVSLSAAHNNEDKTMGNLRGSAGSGSQQSLSLID